MVKRKKYPFWFEDPWKMARRFFEEPMEFKFRFPPLLRSFPVDIAKTNGDLVIKADLPGFSKDEIKVKLTSTTLEISAEKKKQSIESGKNFFRRERSYGNASRFLTLPVEVKAEQARAKFENGILTIEVPLKEIKAKEKKKEVKIE